MEKEQHSHFQQASNSFDIMTETKFRNKIMTQFLSKQVSFLNADYFSELLKSCAPDCCDHIHRVTGKNPPLVDEYDRITYYYAVLAGVTVHVYQPGTFLFESGVQKESPLAIFHEGVWRNGAVLSGCGAVFLARFVSGLVKKYNKQCAVLDKNPNFFIKEVYLIALRATLDQFFEEDLNEYHLLSTLRTRLFSLHSELQVADFNAQIHARFWAGEL